MRFTALILSTALLVPLAAMAGKDSVPPVTDPLVKKECGACHMAFQPAFLPAASWRKIMVTLDDHFGEDASLDAGTRDKVESYLITNAGRGRGDRANPPLRITELNWFRKEHREGEVKWLRKKRKEHREGEVKWLRKKRKEHREDEVKWLRKKRNVKTLADCAACHRGADRGYFEDD